jgi:predicted ATPase
MLAIAFTGGPGFGKSTTLAALEARGYQCVPESARAIIQERMRIGLPKRPAVREFAEQILRHDQAQYRGVQRSKGLVFFDRGVIDALGMCYETGQASWVEIQQVLRKYPFHVEALVFPPWEEIYAQDTERDQSFEDAVRIDRAVRRWYQKCGFELVEVPRVDAEARCDFILTRLRQTRPT